VAQVARGCFLLGIVVVVAIVIAIAIGLGLGFEQGGDDLRFPPRAQSSDIVSPRGTVFGFGIGNRWQDDSSDPLDDFVGVGGCSDTVVDARAAIDIDIRIGFERRRRR